MCIRDSSWVGYALDGVSHKLGALVLTSQNLESFWTYLYDLPLMPWTRFNNTVVMGSMILAFLAFFPVYRISCYIIGTYGPRMRRRLERNRLVQWMMGGEVNAELEGA